jgi:predicted dehydrogenase
MNNMIIPRELGIVDCIPRPKRSDWRIGVVGCGGVFGSHITAYLDAGWQVVAVADTDPQALERAHQALPGARLYESYQDLVSDVNVEVISLLTQPNLREPVVEAAFRNGKPVLTEKPFATTIEACERMAALSEQYGQRLAVSQNFRWSGANFFAREIIKQGFIGSPFYAAIEIQGRQDIDLAGHPFYSQCEGFLTIHWNNHLADLLRYWLAMDPIRVLTCTRRMKGQHFKSDNLFLSIVDYGDNVTGHITHSELLRSTLGCTRCRVDGDAGSLVFDLYGSDLTIDCARTGQTPCKLDLGDVHLASSFSGPMGDLLISLEEGREPETSARRNLPTIRHVLAEERSARAGGAWIPL